MGGGHLVVQNEPDTLVLNSLSAVDPLIGGSQSSDPPSVEEGFLQNAEAFNDFGFIIISADLRLHFTHCYSLSLHRGRGGRAAGVGWADTNTNITFCSGRGSTGNSSHRAPSWATVGHAQCRGPRVYHGTKR